MYMNDSYLSSLFFQESKIFLGFDIHHGAVLRCKEPRIQTMESAKNCKDSVIAILYEELLREISYHETNQTDN